MTLEPTPDSQTEIEEVTDRAIEVPDDEQLYCPACAYNLTGLVTARCPECGSLFDLEALRAIRDDELAYTMPWELTDQLTLRQRLLYTAYVSVGRPEPFCKSFGFIPRRTRAARFFLICVVLISASVAAFGAISAIADASLRSTTYSLPLAQYLVLPAIFSCLYIVLLTLVASALIALLTRHRDRRRHFWPWWTMLRYAAAHFLLVPLFLPFGILLSALYRVHTIVGVYGLLAIGQVASTFLWAFTIRHLVRHRTGLGRLLSWSLFLFLLVFAMTGGVFLAIGIDQLYDWLYFAILRFRRRW